MARISDLQVRLVRSFDDPLVCPQRWELLLRRGSTDAVNLTWLWQRAWWETFGTGELLLVAAVLDGEPLAVAPWFAANGMVMNLCPEDHLDIVGDVSDPQVLDALLVTARASCRGFVGFRFYFLPDSSPTAGRLEAAATRLGLSCCEEATLASPYLRLTVNPEQARKRADKSSLRRHERYFLAQGGLHVDHLRSADEIQPHLDEFFAQHVARRAVTPFPSLFVDPRQRDYYRRLTHDLGSTGWLRFTRLEWQGRAIAFHFGLCYRGRFLWGIPTFDIELARQSPGEVLLRQTLLAAIDEGARVFDFGPGDEGYKHRFADATVQLRTIGLYPANNSALSPYHDPDHHSAGSFPS